MPLPFATHSGVPVGDIITRRENAINNSSSMLAFSCVVHHIGG